jgi:hypothetical protein
MKQVATITVRQHPDEPRLKARIYRANLKFYVSMESDHPAIPPSIPMPIQATNFKDAKAAVEKFLHISRAVLRAASGKPPDLPEHMQEIEAEAPAFLHFLLTNSFIGQN